MAKYVVGAVADIPSGGRRVVEIRGRKIVIFNLDGAFYGLLDRCPHQGGPLSEGRLIGLTESAEPGEYRYSRSSEILRCPWHGWEFDIRTGRSRCEPDRVTVTRYGVEVAEGRSLPDGAYRAETVDVTVEDSYIVVEV